jgi:hypothetical protein
MAVYGYSDEAISRMLQRSKRTTFRMRVIGALWLAVYLIAAIVLPIWFGVNPFLMGHWPTFLFVLPFVMLTTNGVIGRNASKRMTEYLRAYSVDV